VIDAAYFTAVTMTTIGYGDIAPTHAVSKLFTIFFIFMGVGVFLFSVTVIAEHYFGRRITTLEKTVDKVSQQAREAIIRMGTPEPQTGRSYMKQVVMEHNKPRKPLQQKQETKK
ncbi:potassium channel family protein, partial [Candidatus Woesearchaeota archaeon]|nr:potassium channel family protein [Candidatus Woesearchaeota archaeon]